MPGHINHTTLREFRINQEDEYVPELRQGNNLKFSEWESRHKTGVYRLGLYLCNRAFGGHEEGGWWFAVGELRGESPRVFTDLEEAKEYRWKLQDRVDRLYNNERGFRADLDSVCCEGRYCVEIWVDNLPKAYPTEPVYYE